MRSSDYWKKRLEAIAARQQALDGALVGRLSREYDSLRQVVDRDLAQFYGRYAANGRLTMAEARKRLTGAELEQFRLSLEEFRDKALAGGYDRELNELYLRGRVSRLQALQTQLDLRARALFQSQQAQVQAHLAGAFEETYYRTIFELGRGLRIPASFARLDTAMVERVLERPWLEEHFSGRIWGNRDTLRRELSATLSQGLVRGDSLDQMSAALAKRMEASRARAATLVETESAHFAAEATLRGYQETGVDRYDFLASLDERSCEVCGALDGRDFKVSEQETGINYPPMHPRCRCTTVPHFDDQPGGEDTRAARDAQSGKTVQIPANVTYEQWRKQMDNAGEGDITNGMQAGADQKHPLKNAEGYAIIGGGRITDPDGASAVAHAERYYGLVRSMGTDVAAIAKNTGFSEADIQRIKSFIFLETHDLGGPKPQRFDPDFAMAQSWQRLIDGKAEPHDLTLLNHELLEKQLMDSGMTQYEAHIVASQKYNYGREVSEFYASLKEHSD